MSTNNPYANVEDNIEHRNEDSDYFSSMSQVWAAQSAQAIDEANELPVAEVIYESNSGEILTEDDWNIVINEVPPAEDEEVVVGKNATNPGHYNSIPEELQHWNVVHKMGWDYYLGNATKYIWRAGKKASAHQTIEQKEIEDLKKAIVYLNKKIELLQG
tara:strand:+ start:52 stop:528 length:477 start_codon:yes stop_codon:yes gene_type:complete